MTGGGLLGAADATKRSRTASPDAGAAAAAPQAIKRRSLPEKQGPSLSAMFEGAQTLEALLSILSDAGKASTLDALSAAEALRQMPRLLALAAVASIENLAKHFEAGQSVEAASLPSTWPEDPDARAELWQDHQSKGATAGGRVPGTSAFLWAHERIEEALDDSKLRDAAPLSWLADVAALYGTLRPAPLPIHVLEDCADEALRRLQEVIDEAHLDSKQCDQAGDLAQACRIARGIAMSQALSRHGLYAAAAERVAAALGQGGGRGVPAQPWGSIVHDAALALALVRPWDADAAAGAAKLLAALGHASNHSGQDVAEHDAASSGMSTSSGAPASCVPVVSCTSRAGERNGEPKENQDLFHVFLEGDVAFMAVIDGHGKRGAAVASEIRSALRRRLPCISGGLAAAQGLADALLAADAALLLNARVDAELSGATCAVLRIEGLASSAASCRRLAVAHVGDCRAIVGRREADEQSSEGVRWTTARLTQDHRPDERSEATRLVAAGGRIQKAPLPASLAANAGGEGPAASHAGPSRLWHRGGGGVAPGLAMSRGLGDVLGQGCGLLAEATALEVPLGPGDAVVVVASDGVFDVLSDAEVLHCCRVFWPSRSASEASAAVVAAAARAWAARGPAGPSYRDDCTCAVLFF